MELQIITDKKGRKWTAALLKCTICEKEWVGMWDIEENPDVGINMAGESGEGGEGRLECPHCDVDVRPEILAPVGALAIQEEIIKDQN